MSNPIVYLIDEPRLRLVQGNCLDVMALLDAASVDAVVCDPPYGLDLPVTDAWDKDVPGPAFWAEALRVAKPGAHLCAFSSTRTVHKLGTAIEEAGWEIRDCLMWMYSQGFPKGMDAGQAIDNHLGVTRKVTGTYERNSPGTTMRRGTFGTHQSDCTMQKRDIPATPEAAKWDGWKTHLKPCWEPVILARKPLEGTIAASLLKYGTGAINVKACRTKSYDGDGLWAPNILHDGSEPVIGLMGGMSRCFYEAKVSADPGSSQRIHPTMKPVAVMRWLCSLVTQSGGLVLDPFCGSGATLVAAGELGLRAIGIEIDPTYAAATCDRLRGAVANAGQVVDHPRQLGLFGDLKPAHAAKSEVPF